MAIWLSGSAITVGLPPSACSRMAIASGNEADIRRIKGVGPKTAQRLILELRDKFSKLAGFEDSAVLSVGNNIKEEALMALVTLGFPRPQMEKILTQMVQQAAGPLTVEELIKKALRSV